MGRSAVSQHDNTDSRKATVDQRATDAFYSHHETRPPEPVNLTMRKRKNAPDSENDFCQQESDLKANIQPTHRALSQKHKKDEEQFFASTATLGISADANAT